MAENPKVNLALVNNIPDGNLEQGTIYMSPDVSGNFIKVAVTDSSTVTIFDGSSYATKQYVIDNEYVVATALADLNNRVDNIDVELLMNITYSELKALRDTSTLVPGMQYRITDYECTTSAENTSVGGHAFDIIVTADSSDTLNENCRAMQHADDAYFANNNLEAWELKYSFDGDCTKFAWGPNSVQSFTFLYSEDTPTAVRYPEGDIQNKYAWNIDGYDISGIYYTSTTDIKHGDYINFDAYDESTSSFSLYGTGGVREITGYLLPSEYRGIIFYMKDEFDNECGYDFKNIKFAFVDSSSALIDSSTHYYYTFTDASTDGDLSMKKDSSTICEKNYIMAINDGSVFTLPHTVFIASNSVFNNTIKRASNNVFGTAYNNDMGMIEDCVFDNVFDLNTVETALNTWLKGVAEVNHIKYISNSEFGNNFAFNTIRYMSNTKAGDGFMLNDVGDYFINSSFGNNCFSNFFGPYSGTITTGNDFAENTMQNQCHHLTFGNSCKFNNMGTVGYVRMGNNCTDNFIGNGKYIYFGNSSNQGADWICGNKFEGITQYVYFYNTGSASLSNMLRKYHMYNICGTSDSWKSISETTRNNSKETFVLTRPGYTTPAANSLIYVDPAMLPERTKGGTAGQLLVKDSSTDYDMSWRTVNIGSQIVYDSSNKVISLKDASGNVLGTPVDATDFIKDGMVSDVSVYDGNLVISFNTDAGKEDIAIPLSDMFDSSNYYTKSESDTKYAWDSSSPWEPGSGTGSAQLKGSGADASGNYSVAEGKSTDASGDYSHAEGQNTTASGYASHAEGIQTKTFGSYSHAEGDRARALGYASHAEGCDTSASGFYSHAEGYKTDASGNYSHAEGTNTDASGNYSHAEGSSTRASGDYSHAEGFDTSACGNYSHTEGYKTDASGNFSHAEGYFTDASGSGSHAEGESTIASGNRSHAEGIAARASGNYSHAEGEGTIAHGQGSHAEGFDTSTFGNYSHAEGNNTTAQGDYSHAEGNKTKAKSLSSHAEGGNTTASGSYSHAEGCNTTTSGSYSHAEGRYTTTAAKYSHAEGDSTTTSGYASHAEGSNNNAQGDYSHAEGNAAVARGTYSHAEGRGTVAQGAYSHAEGSNTNAQGEHSHAEGDHTVTSNSCEHAQGAYNFTEKETIFSIGIGSPSTRKNIMTVNKNKLYINKVGNYKGGSVNDKYSLDYVLSLLALYDPEYDYIFNGGEIPPLPHPVTVPDNIEDYLIYINNFETVMNEIAEEYDYANVESFMDDVFDDPDDSRWNLDKYQYYDDINIDGTTYQLWEECLHDAMYYGLLKPDSLQTMNNNSKETDLDNDYCPFIALLNEDNDIVYDASTRCFNIKNNLVCLRQKNAQGTDIEDYYIYVSNFGGDLSGMTRWAEEYGYSDIDSFLEDLLDDPDAFSSTSYYYDQDIEFDGETYQLWRDTPGDDVLMLLKPDDTPEYMAMHSIEADYHNKYCPFVAMINEDMDEVLYDEPNHMAEKYRLLCFREK
jgi:hypothetical protein